MKPMGKTRPGSVRSVGDSPGCQCWVTVLLFGELGSVERR